MSDILIIDEGDGGTVKEAESGDIVQDDTFYTAVYVSLFTGDCYYNAFTENKTSLTFEESLLLPVTAKNLQDCETNALGLLDWIEKSGLAESVTCRAYGDKSSKIAVDITIVAPEETVVFSAIWDNQKIILIGGE